MAFLDVLAQYAQKVPESASATSEAHYDEIAPPFGDMLGRLFGQSPPQQRAGLLTQLLQLLGPAATSTLGSGVLGRVFGSNTPLQPGQAPPITPAQASEVSPADVREIAAHAEQHQPGVVNSDSDFYAHHPDLIKGIGAMGLAVLLGKMARR